MSVIFGIIRFNEENNHTWMLSPYSINTFGKAMIISPEFRNDEKSFQLKFVGRYNPNGVSIGWDLALCHLNPNSSLPCKYIIKVLKDGQTLIQKSGDCTFSANNNEITICDMGAMSNINYDISCRLEFFSEKTKFVKKLGLKFNFEWIFLDKNFSDVVLRTANGKEIPGHKLVLATASPVFKAMFNHDMLENKSQSVDMIDISYDAAVEMLRYIYTGSVETKEYSLAAEVLAAAEKYQLEKLKNECEQILISQLSTENVIEALQVADTYNAKHLEKKAVDFVKRKMNETLPLSKVKDMLLSKARLVSK
ncbi:speckle-type POZ protein A-like [Trichogramma pretiosum]|uniref:speckle-type POZ protein A-like n=1 Tax=Trichogramma pretiosum TaxID=7493 RepID=UPI0006C9D681|nr:speckle-type POZ protein A-like [Trichogramma pretiosum]